MPDSAAPILVTSPEFMRHLALPNPLGRYARTLCGVEIGGERLGRAGWQLHMPADRRPAECRRCARKDTREALPSL